MRKKKSFADIYFLKICWLSIFLFLLTYIPYNFFETGLYDFILGRHKDCFSVTMYFVSIFFVVLILSVVGYLFTLRVDRLLARRLKI